MAYEGNVALINGLIPANGQDFPLVHARHVYVDTDQRLSDCIETLEGQMDDLRYVPMAIDSLTITQPANGIAEKGSTIVSITYSYSCNKVPDRLIFNGSEISEPAKSATKTVEGLMVETNRTFTMQATDHGSFSNPAKTVSKTVTLYFYDSIHWGVALEPSSYDDSFILSTLTNHQLASGRAKTFTVNAGANRYIYYVLPTSMGTPKFTVGGFDGGFGKVAEFTHTNASGGDATYAVWKSDNANLGSTTIVVS